MALFHLNCDDYKEIFCKYEEILKYQNKFNSENDAFLEKNKKNLNRLEKHLDLHEEEIYRIQKEMNIFLSLITQFKKLLRPIIDNDLSGTCPMEKQLSLKVRFGSFLHQHRSFELTLTIYSHLQSLFHKLQQVSFPSKKDVS